MVFVVPGPSTGGSVIGGGGAGDTPAGTVSDFAGSTAPSGWLLCDGTVYNVSAYPTLGTLLGSTYGGNGTTTFGVPDCRGRSTVGAGQGAGLTNRALAATGGAESVVLATGDIPAHSHGVTDPGHTHAYTVGSADGGGAGVGLVNGQTLLPGTFTDPAVLVPASTGISTNNAGGGGSHANMQPFLVQTKIIKT